MTGDPDRPNGPWRDSGLAMLGAGVLIVLASNLVDIVRVHGALDASRTQIGTAIAAGGKTEAQLNALAAGTAALARGGNANAAAVIATMQRNGVNIADPGATDPAASPPPSP